MRCLFFFAIMVLSFQSWSDVSRLECESILEGKRIFIESDGHLKRARLTISKDGEMQSFDYYVELVRDEVFRTVRLRGSDLFLEVSHAPDNAPVGRRTYWGKLQSTPTGRDGIEMSCRFPRSL